MADFVARFTSTQCSRRNPKLSGFAAVILLTGCCAILSSQADAQSALPKREGEPFRLIVRPHVGDTLWLQLEQTVETRSVPVSDAPSANTPAVGASGIARPPATRLPQNAPAREPATTQTIVMRMFAHSLVEATTLQASSLTAFTDSLHVRAGVSGHLSPFRPTAVPVDERQVRLRVTSDGAMAVVDPRPGIAALGASLAGMPPMLPSTPVLVGDSWERDIPIPSLSLSGVRAEGIVRAQFHLDSISHSGRLVFVSMSGTLHREGTARDLPPGTQIATAGTLSGSLVLDRTRGWITEAETIIQVQSDVTPRAGDKSPGRSMDIRLTQRMKVR